MAIAINSKELLTLLEVTPSWQNIMLTGRHGIGKSQILTKYFESKGMRVVALFLGQMSDPVILATCWDCPTRTRQQVRPPLCHPIGSLWTASPSYCSSTS